MGQVAHFLKELSPRARDRLPVFTEMPRELVFSETGRYKKRAEAPF
jgi:hypothetical protein